MLQSHGISPSYSWLGLGKIRVVLRLGRLNYKWYYHGKAALADFCQSPVPARAPRPIYHYRSHLKSQLKCTYSFQPLTVAVATPETNKHFVVAVKLCYYKANISFKKKRVVLEKGSLTHYSSRGSFIMLPACMLQPHTPGSSPFLRLKVFYSFCFLHFPLIEVISVSNHQTFFSSGF